jgi:hypothetical protein
MNTTAMADKEVTRNNDPSIRNVLSRFIRLVPLLTKMLFGWFMLASGGQGALFEKTAPWTPAKTFY